MRDTSVKSWEEIKASDARTKCMRTIVETLSLHGPLTGREICDKADQDGLWKRLSEMQRMGVVDTDGKRKCSITRRTAYIWKLKE